MNGHFFQQKMLGQLGRIVKTTIRKADSFTNLTVVGIRYLLIIQLSLNISGILKNVTSLINVDNINGIYVNFNIAIIVDDEGFTEKYF